MSFFILYLGPGVEFEQDSIWRILTELPNLTELERNSDDGAIIRGRYDRFGDRTLVELKDDRESIALSGIGPAGLTLALEIQKQYPAPIHMVDSGYNFDLVLRDFDDFSALEAVVNQAIDDTEVDT